jgi:ribosomal protein S18 acetylase RimI-like enzyme
VSERPSVRRFEAHEWPDYRDLRLRSLADSPDAFGSTLALEQGRDDAEWKRRLGEAMLSRGDCPVVAELGSKLVGLAWGRRDDAQPEIAHLYQMWVAPEARRVGAGDGLLKAVVEWARATGFTRLVLEVNMLNEPARLLYERAGFEKHGESEPGRAGFLGQEMQLRFGS